MSALCFSSTGKGSSNWISHCRGTNWQIEGLQTKVSRVQSTCTMSYFRRTLPYTVHYWVVLYLLMHVHVYCIHGNLRVFGENFSFNQHALCVYRSTHYFPGGYLTQLAKFFCHNTVYNLKSESLVKLLVSENFFGVYKCYCSDLCTRAGPSFLLVHTCMHILYVCFKKVNLSIFQAAVLCPWLSDIPRPTLRRHEGKDHSRTERWTGNDWQSHIVQHHKSEILKYWHAKKHIIKYERKVEGGAWIVCLCYTV